MLDQNDIQSIKELVKELLDEQETRLTAKIEEARKSAVQESVQYMNVLYETKIEPQFKLLAEGQETLLETLAPKAA